MKNKESMYSNLLGKSFGLFEEARNQSLKLMEQGRSSEIRECWGKVIDITRSATVVSSYKEFHLESAEKTAVIIMGLSCTGKSTISKKLSEEYPNYDVIRFDEIGMRLIKECSFKYMLCPDMLDNDMIETMDALMRVSAKNNHNLIIEGEYCTINARGALMKNLRNLGYQKIFLISTLAIPENIMKICTESRALIYVYSDSLDAMEKNQLMLRSFSEDIMPYVMRKVNVQTAKKTKQFLNHVADLENCRKREYLLDMIPIQVEHDFLTAGAEMFAEWF